MFSTKSIEAAFQLVYQFRNRLHPGNEMGQAFKLTPRIGATLMVFLELGILQWWQPGPLGDLIWERNC